jgi:PqqD family protein of HPr-rel-A system
MMNPPDTVYSHRPDIRYRIIGDEAVVVRQQAAEVVVLNEVAARILQLLDARAGTDSLMQQLQQEFDVEPEQLRRDVDAFLEQLLESGIIEVVTPQKDEGS